MFSSAAPCATRRMTCARSSLSPRKPQRFAHSPRQFMTFAFEIGGETVHRCYTIASAPTRPDTIVDHREARRRAARSRTGCTTICVPAARSMPSARWASFRASSTRRRKYLFLSGGSGITPLMSMARTFYDLAEPRDIAFLHSARSPDDIIFNDELELMARRDASFLFRPDLRNHGKERRWSGLMGRIDAGDARCCRTGFSRARSLRLRARALYGRGAQDAGRSRVRHAPASRGKLRLRGAAGIRRAGGCRREPRPARTRRLAVRMLSRRIREDAPGARLPGERHRARCGAQGGHPVCRRPAPRAFAAPANRSSCRAPST